MFYMVLKPDSLTNPEVKDEWTVETSGEEEIEGVVSENIGTYGSSPLLGLLTDFFSPHFLTKRRKSLNLAA